MRFIIPPLIVSLGLAIMEITEQAQLGFFPTPQFILAISTITNPWFIGMLITTIGACLFSTVNLRPSTKTLIAYTINILAWEDAWYWIIRWHMPYMWNFIICGFRIPYLVYQGVPIYTLAGFIISYAVLIMEKKHRICP